VFPGDLVRRFRKPVGTRRRRSRRVRLPSRGALGPPHSPPAHSANQDFRRSGAQAHEPPEIARKHWGLRTLCPCAACVYGAWAGRESCSWVTRGGRQRHVAGCGPSKPRAYGRLSIFSLRPDAHHQHPERLERRRTKRASKEEQQRIKRTTPVSGTSPETGGPFGAANIARSINPTVSSHQLVPLVPDLGQRGT
jgi:hypothetical protein